MPTGTRSSAHRSAARTPTHPSAWSPPSTRRARTATHSGARRMSSASNVPAGLGSYAHWDRRLDGLIAQAMCSIPSVKGVELGAAVLAAQSPGSAVHDEPRWDAEQGFHHLTNRQGGLAGGVSDGEPVWALVHFKPISTLLHPLRSVDIGSGEEINAHYERSDICVVPAGRGGRRGDARLGARGRRRWRNSAATPSPKCAARPPPIGVPSAASDDGGFGNASPWWDCPDRGRAPSPHCLRSGSAGVRSTSTTEITDSGAGRRRRSSTRRARKAFGTSSSTPCETALRRADAAGDRLRRWPDQLAARWETAHRHVLRRLARRAG